MGFLENTDGDGGINFNFFFLELSHLPKTCLHLTRITMASVVSHLVLDHASKFVNKMNIHFTSHYPRRQHRILYRPATECASERTASLIPFAIVIKT